MTDIKISTEEIAAIASKRTKIKIIGCGGGGNNTINRMNDLGVQGAFTIAVNTDAQDLLMTRADAKLLIGKNVTRGLGAGSNPQLGMQAARENESDIRNLVSETDIVFITAGLGGGTGSGSAPVMAKIARELGSLVVAVVTLPFEMEGQKRLENAMFGLNKLKDSVDTLIIVKNDKLLKLAPDMPLSMSFKLADEILSNCVKGITELITTNGLVNLDFADVKAVMGNAGFAYMGIGESDTQRRAEDAVQKALQNPLLDMDIDGGSGALINVSGGSDLTLTEAKAIVQEVSLRLAEDAKIIWGAQVSHDLCESVRVMIIVTGIQQTTDTNKNEAHFETDLGIEFVDRK